MKTLLLLIALPLCGQTAETNPFENRYALGDTITATAGALGLVMVELVPELGFVVSCRADRFELVVGYEESITLTDIHPKTYAVLRFVSMSSVCSERTAAGPILDITRLRTIRVRLLRDLGEFVLQPKAAPKAAKGTK